MKKEILDLLTEKFGQYIVNRVIVNDRIEIANFVGQEITKACNEQIDSYVGNGSINSSAHEKVISSKEHSWGFDFPGWLGQIGNGKRAIIIGQEPHIQELPIQIVYGFCENIGQNATARAKNLFDEGKEAEDKNISKSGHKKIWYRVAELLKDQFFNPLDVLENCYITDLCHFAPSKKGTVKSINELLGKTQQWESIRNKMLSAYLAKEIKAISPNIIVCQGSPAFEAVIESLSITSNGEEKMKYPTKGYVIRFAKWENTNIIGVPHMGSNFNITNKFWKNHLLDVKNELIKRNITL